MADIYNHLDRIGDLIVVVGPIFLWARRWLRRIENSTGFTKTVAETHLPHVYSRLRRSDDALQLPVIEHPSIVYVNGVQPAQNGRP